MKKIFFLFLLVISPLFGQSIPKLEGRVNDHAGVLSSETNEALSSALKAHEDATSNQLVVLIINSLEGSDIESYANDVFNEWKLGTKANNNGVLLVMAIEDRRVRIEVGSGLEGALPDAICKRIIENEFVPSAREGDYSGATLKTTNAIMASINGEYSNTREEVNTEKESGISIFDFIIAIIIAAVISGVVGHFIGRIGGVCTGIVLAVIGYVFFLPFIATLFVGVFGMVFGFLGASDNSSIGSGGGYGGGYGSGSGYSGFGTGFFGGSGGGSPGFGGGDSGGFSGGGFDGGGGSSDGGGASGSW